MKKYCANLFSARQLVSATMQRHSTTPPSSRTNVARSGLTLIEIMIALTMTLIVLGAMMTAFQFASEKMQGGRAVMELANRARAAETLMRSDLKGRTVETRPYAQTATPNGYFECVEGAMRDKTTTVAAVANSVPNVDGYLGDVDDVLGLTVRASGRPFRGRFDHDNNLLTPPQIIESPLAEVVWFTTWNDLNNTPLKIEFSESVALHRRQLLIAPAAVGPEIPFSKDATPLEGTVAEVHEFFRNNDISARVVPGNTSVTYKILANSLTDLGIRANRFCHVSITSTGHNFPNALERDFLIARAGSEGKVLTDVCGFDLRVYSPDVSVNSDPNFVVTPGDIGYVVPPIPIPADTKLGGYVDLAHGGGGWFSDLAHPKSQCNYQEVLDRFGNAGGPYPLGFANVYDTWTPAYESDRINQDGDAFTDEGTDGLDNDNTNGVDDTLERETLPPYPNPIRGLQVTIRLKEQLSKQVHQTTIVQSFVPE